MLPLIPLFGAIGALAGRASAIANSVTNARNAKKTLAELERHNRAMENSGRAGKGLRVRRRRPRKKTSISIVDVPTTALTHAQMERYAERLQIPHFRGVFMRKRRPRKGPARESAPSSI